MSTPSPSAAKLFQPIQVGNVQLQHRVVMPPMTRLRASKDHIEGDLGLEYYKQRSSVPGTLIITGCTFISLESGGFDNVPGIYTDAQVASWKKITDAVHANGSFIFAQLGTMGRSAVPAVLEREGPFDYVSAGDIGVTGQPKPRPLTLDEIASYKKSYAVAAKNAIAAGFDGVEIRSANGYLLDQFLQDISNNRTDEYGGSVENRARFTLEVVETVTAAIGAERTGLRLSPWSRMQEMGMENPAPQFSYVVEQLKAKYNNLAYLHIVESGNAGIPESADAATIATTKRVLRDLWLPRPYISAGDYSEAGGIELALREAESGVLVAFGRSFLANPDLPLRIKKGIALNAVNYATVWTPETPVGYTDYPFANGGVSS